MSAAAADSACALCTKIEGLPTMGANKPCWWCLDVNCRNGNMKESEVIHSKYEVPMVLYQTHIMMLCDSLFFRDKVDFLVLFASCKFGR